MPKWTGDVCLTKAIPNELNPLGGKMIEGG